MLKYKKMGFKFELKDYDEKYVDKLGRVINREKIFNYKAQYVIKVTDPEGKTLKKEFDTIIPGERIFEIQLKSLNLLICLF